MAVTARDNTAAPGAFSAQAVGAKKKNSRIVAVGMVKTDVDVSGWDAIDATGWQALVTSSDLIILGPVTGQFPEPSANESPGDGYLEAAFDDHSFDVPFHFFNPDGNMDQANRFNRQIGQWSAIFVFEDLSAYYAINEDVDLIPMSCNFRPASESEELGKSRKMRANLKWRSAELPYVLSGLPASLFKLN